MPVGPVCNPQAVGAMLAKADASMTISPDCQGGLILSNPFFSDLIFPGSSLVIPPHFNCTSIYMVGQLEFSVVKSPQGRQKLWQNRIKGIQMLLRILEVPTGQQRARLLINLLCQRFGLEAASQIPIEFMAQLGAVTADAVVLAWQSYGKSLSQLAATRRLGDPAFLAWQQRLYQPEQLDYDRAQPLKAEVMSAA